MRILVDMDDVIADFEGHRRRLMRQLGHPTPVETIHFHGRKTYAQLFGEEIAVIAENLTIQPGFFRDLTPIPGALEALRKLKKSGYEVRICTAPLRRNPYCRTEKLEWLHRYLGPEWAQTAAITSVKSEVVGDYLIDDRPDLKQHDSGPATWKHVLFAQPWNTTSTTHDLRMQSWDDLAWLTEEGSHDSH